MTTGESAAFEVLVVCRANECRSPATAAVLRHELHARGVLALVHSAGIRALPGTPPDPVMADLMNQRGLDLSGHRSRLPESAVASNVDLVIALSRAHLRSLVADVGAPFGRSFTLLELERRAMAAPPRAPDEGIGAWVGRIGAGRSPRDLVGRSSADDVPDPTGRDELDYRQCLAQIERSIGVLCARAFPSTT